MSYEAYLAETFEKCIKILKKKYRNVKDDLMNVIQRLEEDPSIGDPIPGWKKEIWKIRVASSDIRACSILIYPIKINSYKGTKTKLTQKYGLFVDVRSQNPAFTKKLTQKMGLS